MPNCVCCGSENGVNVEILHTHIEQVEHKHGITIIDKSVHVAMCQKCYESIYNEGWNDGYSVERDDNGSSYLDWSELD